MFFKLLVIGTVCSFVSAFERPFGVSPSKSSFYQPVGGNFKCLTTGDLIPWHYINDDYCDCADGTDEPGTSACSDGVFFCENRGYRGSYITSSRLNDGFCDCCDGSDEPEEKIKCSNVCEELGRREQEERDRFRVLQEQGYVVKQEYMQQGKRTKDEKRARLSELEGQMSEMVAARDEMQKKKEEAEAPEKEAKEKHEKAWEELKKAREGEKERVKGTHAFVELDVNNDNVVDYVEMQRHIEFDIDSDGTVSVEEAREHLDDNDGVDMAKFNEKIWTNIKDIYKPPADRLKEEPEVPLPDETADLRGQKEETTTPDGSDLDEEDEDEREDREEEDEEDERDYYEETKERGEEEKPPATEEEKMPPYDAETQALIDAAEAVRSKYNEADSKVRDAENEVNGLKQYLEVDYGPEEEFGALRGQCFDFTDREYTYKLCPFDKTSQRPKAGGIETSLGKWGHWYGPDEDKYDSMKYENGQSCWNGPSRSTHVNLHCGTENKLTGASEPSRCEYQFEFTTPARCSKPESLNVVQHEHTEL